MGLSRICVNSSKVISPLLFSWQSSVMWMLCDMSQTWHDPAQHHTHSDCMNEHPMMRREVCRAGLIDCGTRLLFATGASWEIILSPCITCCFTQSSRHSAFSCSVETTRHPFRVYQSIGGQVHTWFSPQCSLSCLPLCGRLSFSYSVHTHSHGKRKLP